jgi:hypothetical protein
MLLSTVITKANILIIIKTFRSKRLLLALLYADI